MEKGTSASHLNSCEFSYNSDPTQGVKRKRTIDDLPESFKKEKKNTGDHLEDDSVDNPLNIAIVSEHFPMASPVVSEEYETDDENENCDAPTDDLIKKLSELIDSCQRPSFQAVKKSSKQKIHFHSTSNDSKIETTKRIKNKRKNNKPKKRIKTQVSKKEDPSDTLKDSDWFTDEEKEEFSLTIDESKKKKRPKLSSIPIPDEMMEMIVKSGIDDALEEKAERRKLTATHVKNIIKHIVTDENVCHMVRNSVLGINDDELLFEPKLTRAKRKELFEKQLKEIGDVPCASPWMGVNLDLNTSVGTPLPDTIALITTEFPEEEDDEEYQPGLDEQFVSDEESDVSKFGTPNSTTHSSVLLTPKSASNTPQFGSSSRTPLTNVIGMVHPNSKMKFVQRSLDFTKQDDKLEQIGCRTRSKYPMTDTPIEYLESLLNAPDVTPDLYYTGCDNEDYQNFLSSFIKTQENNEETLEDDEQFDPEYNILQDVEGEVIDVEDIQEEMRDDKGVRISKIEETALLKDFLDNFDEDLVDDNFEAVEDQENDIRHHDSNAFHEGIMNHSFCFEECNNQFQQRPEQFEEAWKPQITVTFLIPQFSQHQIRVLESQLAQHAQLLATTIINTNHKPLLNYIKLGASQMLNNMLAEGHRSKPNAHTLFHPKNLMACIEAVTNFESQKDQANHQTDKAIILADDLANYPSRFQHNTTRLEKFPPFIKEIYLHSTAFIFPQFLPPGLFHTNLLKRRGTFRISEYWLLASCLKELVTDSERVKYQTFIRNAVVWNQDLYNICKKIGRTGLFYASGHQIAQKIHRLLYKNKTYGLYEETPVVSFFKTGYIDLPPATVEPVYKRFPCCVKDMELRYLPDNFRKYVKEYRKQGLPTPVLTALTPSSNQNIVVIQDAFGTKIVLPPTFVLPGLTDSSYPEGAKTNENFPSYCIYKKQPLILPAIGSQIPSTQSLPEPQNFAGDANNVPSNISRLNESDANGNISEISTEKSFNFSDNLINRVIGFNPPLNDIGVITSNFSNTVETNNGAFSSKKKPVKTNKNKFKKTNNNKVSSLSCSEEPLMNSHGEVLTNCSPLTNSLETSLTHLSKMPTEESCDFIKSNVNDKKFTVSQANQKFENTTPSLPKSPESNSSAQECTESLTCVQYSSDICDSPNLNSQEKYDCPSLSSFFGSPHKSPLARKTISRNQAAKGFDYLSRAIVDSNLDITLNEDSFSAVNINKPNLEVNNGKQDEQINNMQKNSELTDFKLEDVDIEEVPLHDDDSKIIPFNESSNFKYKYMKNQEKDNPLSSQQEIPQIPLSIRCESNEMVNNENQRSISCTKNLITEQRKMDLKKVHPVRKVGKEPVIGNYILKVKDSLCPDALDDWKFKQFVSILQNFKKNPATHKQIFAQISKLLSNHPVLIDEFVIFLSSHQAQIVGKSREFEIMYRTRTFINELEEKNLIVAEQFSQLIETTKQLFSNDLTTVGNAFAAFEYFGYFKEEFFLIVEKYFARFPKVCQEYISENQMNSTQTHIKETLTQPKNESKISKNEDISLNYEEISGMKHCDDYIENNLGDNEKKNDCIKCDNDIFLGENICEGSNKETFRTLPKNTNSLKKEDNFCRDTGTVININNHTSPLKSTFSQSPHRTSPRFVACKVQTNTTVSNNCPQKSHFDLKTDSSETESQSVSPTKIPLSNNIKSRLKRKHSAKSIFPKTRTSYMFDVAKSGEVSNKTTLSKYDTTSKLKMEKFDSVPKPQRNDKTALISSSSLKCKKYCNNISDKVKISEKNASNKRNNTYIDPKCNSNIGPISEVRDTQLNSDNNISKRIVVENIWTKGEDALLLSLMKEEGLTTEFFSTIANKLGTKSIAEVQSRIDIILALLAGES